MFTRVTPHAAKNNHTGREVLQWYREYNARIADNINRRGNHPNQTIIRKGIDSGRETLSDSQVRVRTSPIQKRRTPRKSNKRRGYHANKQNTMARKSTTNGLRHRKQHSR